MTRDLPTAERVANQLIYAMQQASLTAVLAIVETIHDHAISRMIAVSQQAATTAAYEFQFTQHRIG